MIFSDRCYTGDLTIKKQARIQKKIRKGKPIPGLYLIVLPLVPDGLLEIYSYSQLLQKVYRRMDSEIRVVGFSRGKGAAEELVLQMIQDICDADGEDWNIEDYFF